MSWATELFEYGHNIRALGMGMAYTALARDTDALYYNPAAFAEISGLRLRPFDIGVGVNGQEVMDTVSEFTTFDSLEDLNGLYGKRPWIGFGLRVAFAMPYFGFGVYDSGFASFYLTNPAMPAMNVNYANDMAFAMGGGIHLAPGLSFGITGKRILRQGYRGDIPLTTLASNGSGSALLEEISNRGWGYGVDLGLLYVIKAPVLTTSLAAVWKDAGDTSFQKESGKDSPPHIDGNQILGAAVDADLFIGNLIATVDYRHANEKVDLGKKLHAGLELSLPLLDIRGGFSQGYYSYGMTLDLWLLLIDLATYGVELGAYPGQTEDRRYMLTISSELGFDPNFSFNDSTGRRRKLKQRR
ncbi:MAG: hypothetical protein AB7H97_13705 [Pseudobdellovibrionaceae bacterium]